MAASGSDDSKKDDSNNKDSLSFSCLCGECEVTVSHGEKPIACVYCHCKSCRMGCQVSVNHALLYKPDDVTLSKGQDIAVNYANRDTRTSTFCPKCGYALYNTNASKLIVMSATNFSNHNDKGTNDKDYGKVAKMFEPTCHLWYSEAIGSNMDDDPLPKFIDYPKAFGGTDKKFEKPKV